VAALQRTDVSLAPWQRCKSLALYLRCVGTVAACNGALAAGRRIRNVESSKFQKSFSREQRKDFFSETRKYGQGQGKQGKKVPA